MHYLLGIFLGMMFACHPHRAESQTIKSFLQAAKKKYGESLSDKSQSIHFVMGNESADLDSVASSILYAYLLQHGLIIQPTGLFIPLLNIQREELSLRKDVLYLFKLFDISSEDLLFLDDEVCLNQLLADGRLRLNLVDHNALRPPQSHLFSAVERIIDHHADEKKLYPLLNPENKWIATVGSTATLVAEQMLANPFFKVNAELALFLLAPILMDTANLKSAEKTTEQDLRIVEILKTREACTDLSAFYEELLAAKNDVSDLTPALLLNKDFKEYADSGLLYGISTLPATVCWEADDLSLVLPSMEKFAADKRLGLLIVLMANQNPHGPKRKLIIYSPFSKLLESFQTYVQADVNLRTLLIPEHLTDCVSFYWIDAFISRKKLQPLFDFSELQELAGSL